MSDTDRPIKPQEEQQQEEPDYFGGCPVCAKNAGYLNYGPTHWFFCAEHKTRWSPGANLFSSWRAEEEADWQRNAETLIEYTEVEPLLPSYCRPLTKEEMEQELREEGWIEEGDGAFRNPNSLYPPGFW